MVPELKTFFKEVLLDTADRKELINITNKVAKVLEESKIDDGICLIYSVHSTSAIIINENEEGLRKDLLAKVLEDYPIKKMYLHNSIDDNAEAHLAGAFIGPSITIPIHNGELILGTWQNIFFLELDGPRKGRKIMVEVLGILKK